MFKRISIFLAVVILLTGCGKAPVSTPITDQGVKETGVVIDVSDKIGQTVSAQLGDIVYFKLTGEGGSGRQWSVTAPTSSPCVVLKDQHVDRLVEPHATSTFEYWLLVEQACPFTVSLEYGKLKQKSVRTFSVQVNVGN